MEAIQGFQLVSRVFGWALLVRKRKEITKKVQLFFFLGSQEDLKKISTINKQSTVLINLSAVSISLGIFCF